MKPLVSRKFSTEIEASREAVAVAARMNVKTCVLQVGRGTFYVGVYRAGDEGVTHYTAIKQAKA